MLSISTDLPFIAYTLRSRTLVQPARNNSEREEEEERGAGEGTYVSPGLFAVGPGRFSVSGVRAMMFTLVSGHRC